MKNVFKIGDKILINNRYFINEVGEVFTYKYQTYLKLRPFKDGKRGYLKIKLYDTFRNPITVSIHRLVYTLFNSLDYYVDGQINHIDGNKENNVLSNLELVSPKENVRHSIINKLSTSRAHQLTLDKAKEIYKTISSTNLTDVKIGKIYGYTPKVISKLRNNTHTLSNEILKSIK